MSTGAPDRRPSITESPWYWVYVFSTAGLVGLMLLGPKMLQRQAQEERSFQGRRRAEEQKRGQTPATPMSDADSTLLTLRPIYLILGGTLLVAWVVFWWQHFGRRRTAPRADSQGVAR